MAPQDQEQNQNASNASAGELSLSFEDKKTFLQEFENMNTSRHTFKAQLLYQSNPTFYGDPRSERRQKFIRFFSNHVKRKSPLQYAKVLKNFVVRMGQATEGELKSAEAAVDEEAPAQEEEAPPAKHVKFAIDDKPPVFCDDNDDELTSITQRLTDFSFDNRYIDVPPGKHNVNGSVASPNSSFESGFGSRAHQVTNHIPAMYIPDFSEEMPQPIYVHPDGNGHHHGEFFMSTGSEMRNFKEHNTLSVEVSCVPEDKQFYNLRMAKLEELHESLRPYFGRAIFAEAPAANYFTRQTKIYAESGNLHALDPILKARKAADTQISGNKQLEKIVYLILLPMSMKALDNYVFSGEAHDVQLHRTTKVVVEKEVNVKVTDPKGVTKVEKKEVRVVGLTLTWTIAFRASARQLDEEPEDMAVDEYYY